MQSHIASAQCNNNESNNDGYSTDEFPQFNSAPSTKSETNTNNYKFGYGAVAAFNVNNSQLFQSAKRGISKKSESIETVNDLAIGKTSQYLEMMFPIKSQRMIAFGVFSTWNQLDKFSLSQTVFPAANFHPETSLSFTWDTHITYKTFTLLAVSDIEILEIAHGVNAFLRGELGFTNYALNTKIGFFDNCGCSQNFLINRTVQTTNTAGLGWGLSLGREWFEIRAIIGYRIHNTIATPTVENIINISSTIDEENYLFDGYPDKGLFSVELPQKMSTLNRKTNLIYGQVGLSFRIGSRWNN